MEQCRTGVVEEGQPGRIGGGNDVAEQLRLPDLAEFVVEQGFGVLPQHRPGDLAHAFHHGPVVVARLGKVGEDVMGAADLRSRIVDVPDVVEQQVADHPAQMPAGQRIVADKGDAVGCQHPADQRHQRGAHRGGHPGINAVGDDIVELARKRLRRSDDIAGLVDDVGQSGCGNQRVAPGDRCRRQVEVVKACVRIGGGHGDDVGTVTAAKFEHSRGSDWRRVQPMQAGDGRQPFGMGRRKHHRRVGDKVIGRRRAGHRSRPAVPVNWRAKIRRGG